MSAVRLEDAVRRVLKDAREDADLTQRELGERVYRTRDVIANIEGGRREVRLSEFVFLAVALKESPEQLLRRALLLLQLSNAQKVQA